jgi:hypothetical protein
MGNQPTYSLPILRFFFFSLLVKEDEPFIIMLRMDQRLDFCGRCCL